MPFKQKLSKATGIAANKLPSSYQVIGDVLLLKLLNIKSRKQKEKIANAALSLFPYVKTVCEIKEIKGEFRQPLVAMLAGRSTVTIHKENDVLFKIDVSHIMFSKGNLNERKRLIGQVKENENIIDMFAGIGYFSLGLAKFTPAREIVAIEKNPAAYNFLTENITLNKLNNVNAINGDCRQFAASFGDMADRIIMGYLPGTEAYLPFALHMAKNGCTIHFHNTYKRKDLWKKPFSQIEEACKKSKVKFEVVSKNKVKSYAPKIWHVVIDFTVFK